MSYFSLNLINVIKKTKQKNSTVGPERVNFFKLFQYLVIFLQNV